MGLLQHSKRKKTVSYLFDDRSVKGGDESL